MSPSRPEPTAAGLAALALPADGKDHGPQHDQQECDSERAGQADEREEDDGRHGADQQRVRPPAEQPPHSSHAQAARRSAPRRRRPPPAPPRHTRSDRRTAGGGMAGAHRRRRSPRPAVNGAESISQRTGRFRNPPSIDPRTTARTSDPTLAPRVRVNPMSCMNRSAMRNVTPSSTARITYGTPRLVAWARPMTARTVRTRFRMTVWAGFAMALATT